MIIVKYNLGGEGMRKNGDMEVIRDTMLNIPLMALIRSRCTSLPKFALRIPEPTD